MAGDAGDEFAAESQQNASQMLSFLMYRAGMKAAQAGLGKSSDMLSSAFRDRLPARAPWNGRETNPAENEQERSLDMRGLKDRPEAMEVLVDNEADFEFIKSVMNRNNIEYTIEHETAPDAIFSMADHAYSEGAGIAVFKLPNRDINPKAAIHAPFSNTDHVLVNSGHPYTQLKDLDREVLGLFDFFSRTKMIEKWALRGAIDGLTKDGLLQDALSLNDMKPFKAGAKKNLVAEFATVKWDPQARIIADPLERMGVPFKLDVKDGIACFEVSPECAKAFKAVADFHLRNEASRISLDRFPNYSAIEQAALGSSAGKELIEVTVADQGAAALITDEFNERGVAFESLSSRTTGESTFLVSKDELAAKAPELAAAQQEFADARRTPGKSTSQRTRQQAAERELGSTVKAPAPTSREGGKVSAARKPTPTRDQQVTAKSARTRVSAQNKKLSHASTRAPRAGK